MKQYDLDTQFVICMNNTGYAASLEVRKIYQVVPDKEAFAHNMLRVIDESGEDYLYPIEYFTSIELPSSVQRAFAQAA